MKRILSALAVLLALGQLVSPAMAAHENERALSFGAFSEVYTVWAEYASSAAEGSLTVTFRSIQGQTISNYKDGVLYVAVVSTSPLDLTQPVAWVAEKDRNEPPVLTLTKLRLNEKAAALAFSPDSLDAVLSGGVMKTAVKVRVAEPCTCKMVTAAYRSGQMIAMSLETVALSDPNNTVRSELRDCQDATEVKVFFLNDGLVPMGAALQDNSF